MKKIFAGASSPCSFLVLFGLLLASFGQAQVCPLPITPPNNVGTISIAADPWFNATEANQAGYAAALNPALFTETLGTNNAGLAHGTYLGWCVDTGNGINGAQEQYTTHLYSSCDPNIDTELPANYPASVYVSPTAWHQINYILNHKNGAYFYNVQLAIWNLIGGPLDASFYGGPANGNPPDDINVVNALLADAAANAASWQPECGSVIAVVVAVTPYHGDPFNPDQLLIIEYPYPCAESISVSKQVACLQPTNDCSTFGSIASGYVGNNEPGFCYEITITNSGNIPLTNITVTDNLLGVLSTQFTNFLAPGASSTAFFKMAFAANATNTVTVVGDAFLANSVTNGSTIIHPGQAVNANASAVALVQPAQIACNLTLSSPLDVSNGINPNAVYLPSASIYSTPPVVTFSVTVYNLSATAIITNINLTSSALTALGCTMPPAFALLPGKSATFTGFCSETVPCPGETLSINATGQVMPGGPVCGTYDLTSTNPISVSTGCLGTISCVPPGNGGGCGGLASLSGNVYGHCDGTTPVSITGTPLPGDFAMSGVTVTLLTTGLVPLTNTTTDINGYYTFTGMAVGTYVVQVTPPANYSETFPTLAGNSQVQITVVACNNVQNFGYADNSPVTVNVPPGSNLGCNPASLPTDASVKATVTASDDRGPLPASAISVAHTTSTSGCLVTMLFTATATGTCGMQNTAIATYTYVANTTAPVISGLPTTGLDLGCNPASVLDDSAVSNQVTVAGNCSSATTYSVTHVDSLVNCAASRVFTIIATDACQNTATQTVTYTWTANTTPPSLTVPSGINYGCNPASERADSDVKALASATGNCGSATTITVSHSDSTTGCVTTRTFTVTATDACGNHVSSPVVDTWTVNTTAPVITVPAGSDLGCNPASVLDDSAVSNQVSVAGNCSSATTYTVTHVDSLVNCAASRVFTIIATDACQNTATQTVTYTWTANTTPPSLTVPPGIAYGCNPASERADSDVKALASATGNCGSATTIAVSHTDSTTGCVTTRTFTVTATDACGNHVSSPVVDTWTVNTTAPVITVPSGSDLGCNPASVLDDSAVSNQVTVAGNCSSATIYTVTHVDSLVNCAASRVFTIIATDACQNTATQTVTYTWTANTTPPSLTVPSGINYGCNPGSERADSDVKALASATGNCGSATTITVSHTDSTTGCVTTRTFTVTATDACGNHVSSPVVDTWTVNTTAPVITVPSGSDLGCNPASVLNDSAVSNQVSVAGNCSSATTYTVTHVDSLVNCAASRVFTVIATDACQNTATQTVTYTWTANTTPPSLTVPAGINYGCNPASERADSDVKALASATGNCGSATTITVSHTDSTTGCVTTRTFTVTATDACGNHVSSPVVDTWTVNTTAPSLTVPSGINYGCNPGSERADSDVKALASATGNCASTTTIAVSHIDSTAGCVTTRTFTVTATDACGNHVSAPVVDTWTTDTTAPVISGVPTSGLALGCNPATLPTVPSIRALVSATDNCGGTPAISVTCADATAGCVTTRTFTITATDTCGNHASATVAYTWTTDTTAPVITGVPTTGLALGCNPTTLPTVASVTALVGATDNCGGSPTILVTSADSTTGCLTTRTFNITATDTCGNHAAATVAYTWTTDTTAPVITGVPTTGLALGCNPATLPNVASITALVHATDNCGGTPTILVTCADSTSGCVTTRTFTITATDACSNHASATVAYTWTTDTTAPVITGVPTTGLALGCNPSTQPSVASVTALVGATDNCGGTPTILVTSADSTTGCLTTRTFNITATDTCGNHASATVAYTWTVDTTAPVLAGVPTTGLALGCNPTTLPTVASVTALIHATDNCGGTPTIAVTSADSTTGCVTTRTFTITASDACGNHVSATAAYTWTSDNAAPVITGVPTTGLALGCNPATLPSVASITALVHASDNCSTPTLVVTSADSTSGCVTTRTFTITATDACGNHASATVAYTWTIDTAAPVLSGVPTGGSLGCNPAATPTDASVRGMVSATDNCSTPTISVTHVDATNGCSTTRTFTITATDACGNVASATAAYVWSTVSGTLTLTGLPSAANLGCNPATIPTAAQVAALVSAGSSSSVTWAFTNYPGALGVSQAFTQNGLTITAYGFKTNGTAIALYGKLGGGDENGLGLNGTVDNEIGTSNFIQIDLTQVIASGAPSATMAIGSVQSGEGYNIYGSHTLGTLGTLLVTNGVTDGTAFPIPSYPTYEYISVKASAANVLLDAVSVTSTGGCSSATISGTSTDSASGCVHTRVYTITASNLCGSVVTAFTTNTWTVDTAAPTIIGVPTIGLALGCNPATLPTDASIAALVSETDNCGSASETVTHVDSTSGCVTTRTFTITAADACGNHATASVAYTWTTDTTTPVISGVPTGGSLGINPTSLPSITSISNMIHVTDPCGTSSYTVTNVDVVVACFTTRTFTITATDACGNHATATVVYTWTSDTGPIVTCPPNVTIATNFNPIYCTFTPSDWNSSCNGSNTTPTWWTTWDQQNHGYNCMISWTNWWTSCTGNNPGTNCWNFCQNQQSGDDCAHWWGSSCNQNNTPSWCSSWNYGNPNGNWWVPCNGYNPGSVLTNCFHAIYSNGCVRVGLTNGNCYTFNSCNAVRQCLSFTGSDTCLRSCVTNPASCTAGNFCSQVLALQLNCDFGDAGASSGFGGPCGDLVLNDSSSPCNGQKVRDICKRANCVLGGGTDPSGCTASYLCGLCSNLNQCFEGCQVSSWCRTHLTPVYIPSPSVTGTATVTTNACTGSAHLTYCDVVAAGACTGSYVITRTWSAVDAEGMSNYCAQTITITTAPGPSISGNVVNDCSDLGCGTPNSCGGWNNWGWNNWGCNNNCSWNYWGWNGCNGWNPTPDFSNENGLPGVTVTLENSSGVTLGTTVTDTNGNFTFANPGAGTYTVVVTPPAGYAVSYPNCGTANQATITINSQCQSITNLLFAYAGTQTSLTFVKTGPTNATCGNVITYNFAVTNTGNSCVQLTVMDPILGGQIFCQNSVAPGQGYTFTKTYTVASGDLGKLTNSAWAIANPPIGPNVTNYSSTVATITTVPVTNSITCTPGSFSTNYYQWCNARLSCAPNCNATLYCKNATITFNCAGGHSYTYQVPDSQVCFSTHATSATNCFDGSKWCSTVPSSGDNEIFLAGCGIAPNANLGHCQSITWTGVFSCDTANVNCNWQFGTSSYNTDCTQYGNLGVKACYNVPCNNGSHYVSTDHAGTPENCKTSCTGSGNNTCYISYCGNSGSGNCRSNPCQ